MVVLLCKLGCLFTKIWASPTKFFYVWKWHAPMATDALPLLANTLVGWSLSCTSGAWRVRHWRQVAGAMSEEGKSLADIKTQVAARISCRGGLWGFVACFFCWSIWFLFEYAMNTPRCWWEYMRMNRSCPNSLRLKPFVSMNLCDHLCDHLYDHLYDPLSLGLYIQHILRSLMITMTFRCQHRHPCQPNLAQEQVIRDSVSLGVSMSVVRRLKAESIGLKKMEAWPPWFSHLISPFYHHCCWLNPHFWRLL